MIILDASQNIGVKFNGYVIWHNSNSDFSHVSFATAIPDYYASFKMTIIINIFLLITRGIFLLALASCYL